MASFPQEFDVHTANEVALKVRMPSPAAFPSLPELFASKIDGLAKMSANSQKGEVPFGIQFASELSMLVNSNTVGEVSSIEPSASTDNSIVSSVCKQDAARQKIPSSSVGRALSVCTNTNISLTKEEAAEDLVNKLNSAKRPEGPSTSR